MIEHLQYYMMLWPKTLLSDFQKKHKTLRQVSNTTQLNAIFHPKQMIIFIPMRYGKCINNFVDQAFQDKN